MVNTSPIDNLGSSSQIQTQVASQSSCLESATASLSSCRERYAVENLVEDKADVDDVQNEDASSRKATKRFPTRGALPLSSAFRRVRVDRRNG